MIARYRKHQKLLICYREQGAYYHIYNFVLIKYVFNNQLVTFIPFLKTLSAFRL